MRAPTACRRGFALVSVLWVLVGVSALALAANLAARDSVASARNRIDLARAGWAAEDCLERARAAIHEALLEAGPEPPGATVWGRMDAEVAASPLLAGIPCRVEMRATGAALDLNAASDETLHRLLVGVGVGAATADSLVDALADWRDPDDVPRPRGMERAGYAAAGRAQPRNGALADVRELLRVRGWDAVPGVDTLLDVEPGRVPLSHAPPAVVAALPGLGPEAAARVAEMRIRGARIADLAAFAGSLSPSARDEAMRRYPELVGAVATEPESWTLRAAGAVGEPPVTQVVEVKLVRAAERAAVVRRRTWIE